MQARTRALSWVWLGLAGVGLALGAWMAPHCSGQTEPLAGMLVLAVAVLLVVLWAVPLTVAGVALLRGRAYGWWVLMIHAGLGCLVWFLLTLRWFPEAVRAVENRIAHGPHWGGFPGDPLTLLGLLAMLVFSGLTVWWLLRDPPENWA